MYVLLSVLTVICKLLIAMLLNCSGIYVSQMHVFIDIKMAMVACQRMIRRNCANVDKYVYWIAIIVV
jgi:hypothetical protein